MVLSWRMRGSLLGVVLATVAGCGTNSSLGNGSNLAVDVDASARSAPSSDDAGGASSDSPFTPLDGPYGKVPDGYTPLATCTQCACKGATYCYGGSPYTAFSACDQTASTMLTVGCHALPPACASEPDCVCLLRALAPELSCYAACTDSAMGSFTVYCPP
ncbi:MAG: hypothetical protein M3O46_10765 [Myxococcota bacterium]|nr:hypothetical protein [Myxococcota bacterium]